MVAGIPLAIIYNQDLIIGVVIFKGTSINIFLTEIPIVSV